MIICGFDGDVAKSVAFEAFPSENRPVPGRARLRPGRFRRPNHFPQPSSSKHLVPNPFPVADGAAAPIGVWPGGRRAARFPSPSRRVRREAAPPDAQLLFPQPGVVRNCPRCTTGWQRRSLGWHPSQPSGQACAGCKFVFFGTKYVIGFVFFGMNRLFRNTCRRSIPNPRMAKSTSFRPAARTSSAPAPANHCPTRWTTPYRFQVHLDFVCLTFTPSTAFCRETSGHFSGTIVPCIVDGILCRSEEIFFGILQLQSKFLECHH